MPTLEGTGRELERYLHDHPEEQYQLVPLAEKRQSEYSPDPNHFYFKATALEWNQALDQIAQQNAHLPGLPPEAFDRETLYEEIW